jgi:hypothetical protein
VETTKERWSEAEAHRVAGEVTLKLPERDARKAEEYFERALVVACAQQAKLLSLRTVRSRTTFPAGQRLEDARFERRFNPVRKGHVLARIGDEDFHFGLDVGGGRGIRTAR